MLVLVVGVVPNNLRSAAGGLPAVYLSNYSGLLVWCVRLKLKEEDAKDKEIEYEMKQDITDSNIK